MKCYNCGCNLSEKDFCTSCGADVSLYKRIMHISNRFYNDGLEKANVRDLSGAIISLRQSLKFNKNNIDARNLLGLVYFEMGEVVAALSEWVISKNLRTKKNIADDYLDAIQNNPSRLETINQTIKKYNQALAYCHQDSNDLAVIQLKKVLSLNPNFIQAHQLLALLYINIEEFDRAKRELEKCKRIDVNNTMTLRLLKEVNGKTTEAEEKGGSKKGKNIAREAVKYQSGNETIIQPLNEKEPAGFLTFFNVIIGIVIGVALAWFLILPARIQNAKADINGQLVEVSQQADAKAASIVELEQKVKALTESNTTLQEELSNYAGKDGEQKTNDKLLAAALAYIEKPNDYEVIAEHLEGIEPAFIEENASKDFVALYEKLMELVGKKVSGTYYTSGYNAYKQEDYAAAIADLSKAYQFDSTNGEALYNLGNAYNKSGDRQKAKETYTKVIELFPDTEKAKKSQDYLNELN